MATATYPPPPPYYRLYRDYLQNPKSAPEPPPPIEGTYICFGGNYTVRITYILSLSCKINVSSFISQFYFFNVKCIDEVTCVEYIAKFCPWLFSERGRESCRFLFSFNDEMHEFYEVLELIYDWRGNKGW